MTQKIENQVGTYRGYQITYFSTVSSVQGILFVKQNFLTLGDGQDICYSIGLSSWERDHYPYEDAHFSLELGKKDVKLCTETAEAAGVPLPFGNALLNRFVSSTSKGRNDLDWSAISLLQSEDAGMKIDDSKYKPQEA